MSKRLSTLLLLVAVVIALPVTTFADTRTFPPPPEKGTIYVVVRHKKLFPPSKTKISINWGRWSKSGTFDAAGWRYSREGFVIKLNHTKKDSVPLTVNTDGSIVTIYQGNPPSQKGDKLWEFVEW